MEDKLKLLVDETLKITQHLECDGATRVMVYILNQNNIAHQVMYGIASLNDSKIFPHYWIELYINQEVYIIDLKSKMWLGDDADQGLFKKDNTNTEYNGHQVEMRVDKFLFQILTR